VAAGWLYDGETGVRRSVEVEPDEGGLAVSGEGLAETVPADALTFVEERDGERIYGRRDRIGWRLGLAGPLLPPLADLLPGADIYGRWIDRVGLLRASVVGIAASAAVLLALYRLPHWVAPIVPDRWLTSYGEALVGDFGGRFCEGPGGQAALDALTRRLAPGAGKLNVRVVDIPIVNAATLPGGNIVVFDKLLSQAKSADEFAGVLGHEIGHYQHRDVAEAIVREFGLGLVVSAIGGDFGGNAHRLISLSYSRDAERAADTASIVAMNRANISPAPAAGFFDRLSEREGAFGNTALSYLSTHPISRKRALAYRRGVVPSRHYTPALSPAEWKALVDICGGDGTESAAER
jgi:Zn-dependent protease with chaperone function